MVIVRTTMSFLMRIREMRHSHTLALSNRADGEKERGYAGVPSGWDAMPYFWMPGAINHHFVLRYVEYLELLSQKGMWVDSFKEIDTIDDDDYDEPPDDWYILDESDYDSSLLTDTNNDAGGDQLWQEEII